MALYAGEEAATRCMASCEPDGGFLQIVLERAGIDGRPSCLKYAAVTSLVFSGKLNSLSRSKRAGEMIDRVVCDGQRTVAALVANFEAKIDHVFFADLQVVSDFLAADVLAPAAFVESRTRRRSSRDDS